LARAMTGRLVGSAAEVHFSYARQDDKGEARPSRLVMEVAGEPELLERAAAAGEDVTETFEDLSRVPFPQGKAGGGASVLTSQSQCAFKAFATSRLGAQGWERAEAGLTAAQRGQLLHEVLHSIWRGEPDGIRTHAELTEKLDGLRAFVEGHVRRVLASKMPEGVKDRMPERYLALEEPRLTRLVMEWLQYEAGRWAFEVVKTEAAGEAAIEGLALKLRLDRVDRLNDGTLLVIDYKTGDVSPKHWELPRPNDVQLPLYAGFARDPEEQLGGLVFGKVRPGKLEFAGRVGDATGTLLAALGKTSGLVRTPMDGAELDDWWDEIRKLARAFLRGESQVNPRDYPKTCERCALQTLCRIQERELLEGEDEGDDEGTGDE